MSSQGKQQHSENGQARESVTTIRVGGTQYDIVLPDADTDYIQGLIAASRAPYEADMLAAMARRLDQNDLVLDVGANIGNHTLYLAVVVGCRVQAFEPNAHLCDGLRRSVGLNGLSERVEVHEIALGASSATGHFVEERPENLGAQRIEAGDGDIPIGTLDSMNFGTEVSAIKVDVEGMELDVLRGAVTLMRRDRPDIYVECADEEAFRKTAAWLEDLGYAYWDTYNATPTHLFLAAERVSLEQHLVQARTRAAQDRYKSVEELQRTRQQLHEANLKYRAANERIDKLKERLAREEAVRRAAEARGAELDQRVVELNEALGRQSANSANAVAALQQALADQKKEAEESAEKAEQLANEERSRWKHEIARLERERDREHQAATEAEKRSRDLLERLDSVQSELVEAREARDGTAQKLTDLQRRFEALSEEKSATDEAHAELEHRLRDAENRLQQANEKYREVTAEQIPALKTRIEELAAQRDQQRSEVDRLSKELRRAEDRRSLAERRLIDLRASRTFQLGYHLRNAATSPRGLARLPLALWRLARQARRAKARKRAATPAPAERAPKSQGRRQIGSAHPDWKPPQPREADARSIRLQADQPRRSLKVACIMDDFTYHSFAPECHLQQLTPQGWRQELEEFQPEVLIIESAWRGKDELWGSKVGHLSEEVAGIVTWCRDKGIPTAFWNKEDPVHFQTFLNTARLFDCVFTTDIDCIHRYKGALGHDRVYFLPFACQPAVNNPIELYHRKDAVSFAGAYYARYPERTRDLDSFLDNLPGWRPVEIYDRNYGKDDPRYQFPEAYQPYIVGTLPFEQIDQAYKGYQYAINLNSIKQSQSMFARRVFELLGSNTVTISNFSRGLRLMFGDLVLSTDSGAEAVRRLEALSKDPERREKLKLAALRKTLSEHTYAHRLDYMHARLTGSEPKATLPAIAVVGRARSETEANLLLAAFRRQRHPRASLFLIAERSVVSALDMDDEGVHVLAASDVENASLAEIVGDAAWIAGMVAEDYYGPNFLFDMALASTYSRAAVVGKSSYFRLRNGEPQRMDHGEPYTPVAQLLARQSLIATDRIGQEKVHAWLQSLPKRRYRGAGDFLAMDVYNYCRKAGTAADQVTKRVDDLTDLDTGISLAELQSTAETTPPAESVGEEPKLGPAELKDLFGERGSRHVKVMADANALRIRSTLADGKHEYVYAARDLERDELASGDELRGFLDTSPGLNVSLVILFLDAQGQRINHVIHQANRNFTTEMPPETARLRLGLRVYQGGEADVNAIALAHRNLEPPFVLGRGRVLVLSNHYPSYDDLYRNGFVHTRVRAYREHGLDVDVFRLRPDQPISWHEFEGVDVTTGSKDALRRMLGSRRYERVAVHFLDTDMWEVLQECIDGLKVVVWVHGAEIHPWWRRKFNYRTDDEVARAKMQSEQRMAFWRGIFEPVYPNLHFVFVSQTFANEVMEDYHIALSLEQYSVIHNPINTDLFSFREKPAAQRKKVLAVRPYASRQYANDIAVNAIVELSKTADFEDLEFHLIGDGPLFEETVQPLRSFKNVRLDRRFATQNEIANLHKAYGVFLCPSRWDSQGVSRDEAMSSGLVPVTTRVAAIPEFVDEQSGVLAEPESPQSLAEGILSIVRDKERFKCLSTNAAMRVRSQSAAEKIVQQELQLLRPCQSED